MQAIILRVRIATIAALCAAFAACSSSPLEVESEAAKGAKFEASPVVIDLGSSGTTASVTLKNPTKRAMSWTARESAGWLSLVETSGTLWSGDTRKLSISGSRAGLPPGTHRTDITFSASNGGGSEVVTVAITVPSGNPTPTPTPGQLEISPLEVDFGATATDGSMTVSNVGEGPLTWTASESAGWLSLAATSGTVPGHSSQGVTLSVQRMGMTAGTYTADVKVSAGSAGSVTGTVTMEVPSATETLPEVMLSGRLVDQFGGQGLSGLTVQFNGSTVQTDATGRFTLSGTPTSTASQLTLSGSGIYRRVTYAATGDALWGLVPASFDMNAYDDVAREDFGTSTIRWVGPPTVYVDTNPEGFAGGSELQTWISEVQVQAAEFVSKWADQTILPQNVIVTSNPPRDYSAGTIVIHFSEDASRYGNTAAIGYARLSWSSGSITGAAVWLRYVKYSGSGGASKRRGILGHELGHAMGLGHMDGSTQASLMAPSLGSKTDLSSYDTLVASLLYGRAPGHTAPDTDSAPGGGRGLLAPAGATAERDWVCTDEDGIVSARTEDRF